MPSKPSQNSSFACWILGQGKSCIVLFAWGGLSHLGQPRSKARCGVRNPFETFSSHQNHCSGYSGKQVDISPNSPEPCKNGRSFRVHRSSLWSLLEPNRARTAQPWWQLARFPSRLAFHRFHGLGSPRSDDGHGPIPGTVALLNPLRRWRIPKDRTRSFLGLKRDPAVVYPNSEGFRLYDGKSPSSGRIDLSLPQGLTETRLRRRRGFLGKIDGHSTRQTKTSTNRKTLRRWPNKKPLTCFCRRRHKTPSIWKNLGHEGILRHARLWTKRPHGPKAD